MNIKLLGITTTYNISEKIPYVMPYYIRMNIDKLIVYDNYSTDNTVEELQKYDFVEIRYYKTDCFDDNVILEIKNNAWKEYINEYDWCIICDFDEVLYSKRNFKEVLREKSKLGKTYLNKVALNLFSKKFPPINDKLIHENVEYGAIWDCDDCYYENEDGTFHRKNIELLGVYGNKILLFDIKRTNIQYNCIGAHDCIISDESDFPFDDEISFFHIKFIDYDYMINNSKLYAERIKESTRYNYFLQNINTAYKRYKSKSINIEEYINTNGDKLYPTTLLITSEINSTIEGIKIIDDIFKNYDTNICYFISIIFYSKFNTIDINYLYTYACKKNIRVFGDMNPKNKSLFNLLNGYKYIFKKGFFLRNPYVINYTYELAKNLSNKKLFDYIELNKQKNIISYNGLNFERYNNLIMKEKTLGCYLIVKNEENNIKTCLENLSNVCDEILVVDTGSNDNTINIIKSFKNVKIDYFTWINDFSAARNYAMSKMESDYIFSIDADELLTDNLIKRILNLKENNFNNLSSIEIYIGKDIQNLYLGGRQIVRNTGNNIWKYSVHEKLYYDETSNIILSPNEFILHNHKEETENYNKYAEIYYNDINKGEINNNYNTSHYFYYLFFTLYNIDELLSRKYLYNCFNVNKITTLSENQYVQLLKDKWINEEEFINNTIIGGYQTPKMILKYYPILKNDINRYISLNWCYTNNGILNENQYIVLAYISYQYGLFNDFIKLTNELIKKYPNSETGNYNINFINNFLTKLNNINLIIDCKDGYNHLPSLINYTSQYFTNIYIINTHINKLKHISFKPFENVYYINNLNEIKNDYNNFILDSNTFYNRKDIKNKIENIIYDKKSRE